VSSYDLTDLATYLDLVKQTSHAMAALTDTHVVDGMSLTLHGAETAAELGKLALWNDRAPETAGEFAKLSKPLSSAKRASSPSHSTTKRRRRRNPSRAIERSLRTRLPGSAGTIPGRRISPSSRH